MLHRSRYRVKQSVLKIIKGIRTLNADILHQKMKYTGIEIRGHQAAQLLQNTAKHCPRHYIL